MSDIQFLGKHINQFQIFLEKYQTPHLNKLGTESFDGSDDIGEEIPALQAYNHFTQARLCTWCFMNEKEAEDLMNCSNNAKNMIEVKLCHSFPKAAPRYILLDLLYSVYKFTKTSKFDAKQTAALLSIFYLTHKYFSSAFRTTAEDVFHYFKDMLVYHSLEYVPDYRKIFEPEDAHKIITYFCKLYLRHLPIIRLLTLPNFGFHLNLEVEPIPVIKRPKKAKESKKKKKDKK